MGREAVWTCDWAGTVTEVRALLESGELILRGGLRRRAQFRAMKQVHADKGELCFTLAGEKVQLLPGAPSAAKWAEIITTPAPTLAQKLGITNQTGLRTVGVIEDESLKSSLHEAAGASSNQTSLIVTCVDTPRSLHAALKQAKADLLKGVPIWIVYRKGNGQALHENAIRSLLRAEGLMDNKVASVSSSLTALRFSMRKSD